MRVFLTAFGLHNPFAGSRLQEHSAMPIAIDAPGGFDLDYSSLVISEAYIIDKTAMEFIRDRRTRFLRPMWHSLTVLQEEGLLGVADFSEPCSRFRPQIEDKTNSLVEAVDPWIPVARAQWKQVRGEFEDFSRLYSLPGEAVFDAAHYGIVNYLQQRDGKISPREYSRLHRILETRRKRFTVAETEEIREVLKPLVAQVLINDLLREQFQAPFIDWDDAQGFYERLHVSQWSELAPHPAPDTEMASHARALLQVVVPELQPGRIEDVVKFVRNKKAVGSLREEFWDLMRSGRQVTERWALALQSEVARAQLRSSNRSRKLRWVGRALAPVTWLLPHAISIAGEALVDVVEEGVDRGTNARSERRFEWYYALQRIRMGRTK